MDKASLERWKWVNALNGTALLSMVVELLFADEPNPEAVTLLLAASAFVGGASTAAEGVYNTEVVSAFDPAEADPEAENELEAPGPDVPDDALAWM
jgi:hypothetical protein